MLPIMTFKEFIYNEIDKMTDDTYINTFNTYSDCDTLYYMSDFNEIMGNTSPDELARQIYYGAFTPNDAYFTFDGYANLKSSNCPAELYEIQPEWLEDELEDAYMDYLRDNLIES